jgi:phage tail sheath gpL-like
MSIEISAVARVVGIDTHFSDLRGGAVQFLPQHIAVVGQGNDSAGVYPLTPYRIKSAAAAADRYGYGSPVHLAARELFPPNGAGVGTIPVTVYPVAKAVGAVAASGTITPSGVAPGVATYWVRAGGVKSAPFTTATGDTVGAIVEKIVAAIDGVLDLPIEAADGTTDADIGVKWAGLSGNDLIVEVIDATGEPPVSGLTFTIVQPTGGATDPDIATALAQLGTTWITLLVNTLGPANTDALDEIAAVGEGRWGQLIRRPFVAFTGNTEPDAVTATAGTALRPTDRVNVQLVAPGSVQLPLQVAAAQVREIALVANDNPPTDYGSRVVRTLIPGSDAVQWNYVERDLAVKSGSSTVEVTDGALRISDVVTMYRPVGDATPAYRHVVDIVKLMTIIYNVDLEFGKTEWNGAPLIDDGQPTTNPRARRPSAAKAAFCKILDSLGLEAIISDPETAKKNTTVSINAQNPKRLDLSSTVQLSGNTNVISVDLFFGFYFGAPTLVG